MAQSGRLAQSRRNPPSGRYGKAFGETKAGFFVFAASMRGSRKADYGAREGVRTIWRRAIRT